MQSESGPSKIHLPIILQSTTIINRLHLSRNHIPPRIPHYIKLVALELMDEDEETLKPTQRNKSSFLLSISMLIDWSCRSLHRSDHNLKKLFHIMGTVDKDNYGTNSNVHQNQFPAIYLDENRVSEDMIEFVNCNVTERCAYKNKI